MQPKTNIINTLINSMNAANPTIAAARKVYQGTTTGVKTLPSLSHKNSNIIRTQTGIQYSLPKSGNVKLDLIRMDGKKVATLVNAHQSMGEQAIALDMKLLAPGLYFFDLRIDGKQEVTKMMVGL